MSPSPRIQKNDISNIYFLTITVIEWINIFTKPRYFEVLRDSLQYCIEHKGLMLYEYVFMTNHIHLIVGVRDDGMVTEQLSTTIGSGQSHGTSKGSHGTSIGSHITSNLIFLKYVKINTSLF